MWKKKTFFWHFSPFSSIFQIGRTVKPLVHHSLGHTDISNKWYLGEIFFSKPKWTTILTSLTTTRIILVGYSFREGGGAEWRWTLCSRRSVRLTKKKMKRTLSGTFFYEKIDFGALKSFVPFSGTGRKEEETVSMLFQGAIPVNPTNITRYDFFFNSSFDWAKDWIFIR